MTPKRVSVVLAGHTNTPTGVTNSADLSGSISGERPTADHSIATPSAPSTGTGSMEPRYRFVSRPILLKVSEVQRPYRGRSVQKATATVGRMRWLHPNDYNRRFSIG